MSWVRLDDGFTEHPKVASLSDREAMVHIRALCYAGRRRDPHITTGILPQLRANKKIVDRLTDVGLWDVNGTGWIVHDWDTYQTRDVTNAERQQKFRDKKRNGESNDE